MPLLVTTTQPMQYIRLKIVPTHWIYRHRLTHHAKWTFFTFQKHLRHVMHGLGDTTGNLGDQDAKWG